MLNIEIKSLNIVLLFLFININSINKEHPFYSKNRIPIMYQDKAKEFSLLKGKKYIENCLNGILLKKIIKTENPKITAIIPVFNCQKTIKESILSIQNQNLSDFEIILVNDFSKDNTLNIINELKSHDSRIKIINNLKNMGTLYSRCIAVLIAKGKYIFSLDNDDMYFDEDIFYFISKKGEEENLDIVGFQTINIWNYTDSIYKMEDIYSYQFPNEYFIIQPELGRWMISFKGKFLVHNNMIWDKCIKSEVYKKAVILLGKKRYSTYLIWAEDTLINYIIFNLAQSFKYIHKYGIFHFKSKRTASAIQPIEHKLFGEIFFLEIIFEFSKNSTDKNFAVEQSIYIKNNINLNKYSNNISIISLKSILHKIITNNYITKLNKRKLKKYFKNYLS